MRFVFLRKHFLFVVFPLLVVMGNLACPPSPVGPPNVDISSPKDGDTFNVGDVIRFTALTDRAGLSPMLVWTSSLQGQFGVTSTFQTSALAEGVHEITVTVTVTDTTDPERTVGDTDTETITITIVDAGSGEGSGEGAGEGAGEGSGEGSGEGMGEGSGEGTGEGSGEGSGEGAGEGLGEFEPLSISLISPNSGDRFFESELIRFAAQAFQLIISPTSPGGDVPATYVWTSSIQGQFGATSDFLSSALVVGEHVITVKVTATDDPSGASIPPGTMATKTFTVFIEGSEGMGEGSGEGMGEGSGEGTGEGVGEGMGEGSGEGMGEMDCAVLDFDNPIIHLDFFEELDSVDADLDGNGKVHVFFLNETVDVDAGTLFTQVVYSDPYVLDTELNDTVVATATASSSTLEGEFLSHPQIAVTRMGSVFVQYLRHSSTGATEWIAHKRAAGTKTFSAGFVAVQRDETYVDATLFMADLRALGDDQVGSAVVKRAEIISSMIEEPTRLEVNVLDGSGIVRTVVVAEELSTTTLDFASCTGFALQDPLAITGPNETFTVVVSRRPCAGNAVGQLYRLDAPEYTVLTGPDMVVLEPSIIGESFFTGPFTFDESGSRHQMRHTQVVTKDTKGNTLITSIVFYRRDLEPEIVVHDTNQTLDGFICLDGEQLNFTLGTPGTSITIGPAGDVAVLFTSEDCFNNIAVLAKVSQSLCSVP